MSVIEHDGPAFRVELHWRPERITVHGNDPHGREQDTVEYVPADQLTGAVHFTEGERLRLLWWLHHPTPPGPRKDLDEQIIGKLNAAGGQSAAVEAVRCAACDIDLNEARAENAAEVASRYGGRVMCGACRDATS